MLLPLLFSHAVLTLGAAPAKGGPGAADIGTASPTVSIHQSPTGRWLTACQARADSDADGRVSIDVGPHGEPWGDTPRLHLFLAPGPGEPIDALAAADPSGRFIVVVARGAAVLIDTATGTRRPLDAFVPPLAQLDSYALAGFDRFGGRVAFLRRRENVSSIVVQRVTTGEEELFPAPAGEVHTVGFADGDAFVEARLLRDDTDGDGQLTWRRQHTNRARGPCTGQPRSYHTGGSSGDRPVRALIRLDDGAQFTEDVAGALGRSPIRRKPDGSLVVARAEKAEELWVPASCGGDVVFADKLRQLLVVLCRKAPPSSALHPLAAFGISSTMRVYAAEGLLLDFPVDVVYSPEPATRAWWANRRFIVADVSPQVLRNSADGGLPPTGAAPDALVAAVYDLERRAFVSDLVGPRLSVQGSRALKVRPLGRGPPFRTEYSMVDLVSGAKWSLVLTGAAPRLTAGDFAVLGGQVVNVATGRVIGSFPTGGLGLDERGNVLVPAATGEQGVVQGPLRWVPPGTAGSVSAPATVSLDPRGAAAIAAAVDRASARLDGCIDPALKRSPALREVVVPIDLTVDSSGKPSRVEVTSPRFANSKLGRCLRRWATELVLPPAPGSGDFDTQLRIPLRRRGQVGPGGPRRDGRR